MSSIPPNLLEWYNSFQPESKTDRKSRGSARTLHAYQNWHESIKCRVFLRGKIEANSKESRIVCGKRHTVFFEVGGGAEMPQFTLVLRLQPLNVEDDDHSQDIRLTAVWTAFGEAGTNTYRTVHRPDVDPDPNINYTFSSRLHNVTFKQLTHSKETAKDCDAKEGNNGWGIWWSHTHPPYCLGFRFPLEAMQFSPQQSEAVKAFRRLSSADMEMMVATQRQGNLADRWRFMAAMPVPTPGLFPYYDCRWAGEHNRFANITDIPPLTDNTIRIHHGLQETGWMNNPPAFSTPFKIVSMGEKAPLTFLNEREYEIFKTVGLLREAQWQKDNKDRVYDQEYQFNLIPADQVHRSGDSSMEDFYYALIDASPKIAVQDSESEHDLTLPPPGTQLEVDTGRPRHQAMAGRGPAPSRDDHRWKGFVVATPKLIDDDAPHGRELAHRIHLFNELIRKILSIYTLQSHLNERSPSGVISATCQVLNGLESTYSVSTW